jgi:hypothetical protein
MLSAVPVVALLTACGAAPGIQLTAAPRAAAAPTVTQLQLSPAYLAAGEGTKAVLKVTTPACLTAARLTVAVRSSTGANLDFPGAVNGVELCPSGYTLTTAARSFTAGTYTLYGSWKDDTGAWHALPSVPLKVGPAAPSPSPTPTPSPPPAGTGPSWDKAGAWKPKFADEFRASALDTSKWTPGWFGTGITGPVNSAETVKYNSANVSVSGGALHLKIQNGYGAHINSDGKYSFSRGAVEYRAFLPASGGQVANWPALWDNGQSWPADGENDTAEGLSGQVCTYWHASGTDAGSCHGGTYAGAWHTYGYEWTPTKVTWYYDGAKVREQATTVSSPHYLILQNTQGEYGGPNASADLQVDYVRVWQR